VSRRRSVTSAAVAPVSTHAVRECASMSTFDIDRRSMTIPPSVVLWPAMLWTAAAYGQLVAAIACDGNYPLHVGGVS
jgi:hypothetical protein